MNNEETTNPLLKMQGYQALSPNHVHQTGLAVLIELPAATVDEPNLYLEVGRIRKTRQFLPDEELRKWMDRCGKQPPESRPSLQQAITDVERVVTPNLLWITQHPEAPEPQVHY